jgi:hypothetical protein
LRYSLIATFMVIVCSQVPNRAWPSKVYRIDEDGYPWIQARLKDRDGIVHHDWGIHERTGWRRVRKRL